MGLNLVRVLGAMHGRPRQRVHDPAVLEEERSRAKSLNALLSSVLKNHHEQCYSREAFEQNCRLLVQNPEVYTAWNYQKLALKHFLDAAPDEDARKKLVDEDLSVNENALRTNIKSYGAWHHRKWLMSFGLSSLDHEFDLLKLLFKLDSRNFNAWNYRRFVVGLKNVPVQTELDFTVKLIDDNFSNYSAWHNRSALLSQLFEDNQSGQTNEEVLNEEFVSVRQAFFLDPSDQSAWIYHTWLMDKSKQLEESCWKNRLLEEIKMCRELLEIEKKDCKYAMLALARLLVAENSEEHAAEVAGIFDELMNIDPMHREYYRDMHSRFQKST